MLDENEAPRLDKGTEVPAEPNRTEPVDHVATPRSMVSRRERTGDPMHSNGAAVVRRSRVYWRGIERCYRATGVVVGEIQLSLLESMPMSCEDRQATAGFCQRLWAP
jgi:hypothetical protein